MKRNSVLFLTNAYPDFESSYRGIFVKAMAVHLGEQGFEVSIVTPKIYKGSPCFERQKGMSVYRFPFFAGNRLLIEYKKIPYLRMILYYITGLLFTVYALLKHRCDLIHVHWAIPTGLIGVVAGGLLGKPLVVTVHGSDLRMAMGGVPLLKRVFTWVCRRAKFLHLVSGLMKREIESCGIPLEKISVWPMSVDEVFLQSGRNRQKRTQIRPVTILSSRNLQPIYDVATLIRAIPLVLKEEPESRFLIAGDGSERLDLEAEAVRLSIASSTRFLGRVSHEHMPELLAQADVYVSTSLSDGTSVSLLEALASGAFPVVTDIPSNQEWIMDGANGFLVPVRDERRLAEGIIRAIRSEALVERACQRNRALILERANWKENIDRALEIYRRVSGKG